MDREACIELPPEDKLPEDSDAVGLLVQSMYGWMRDWQAMLEQGGIQDWCGKPRFRSTAQRNVAAAEFTETTLLLLARVEHWTDG